MMVVSPMIFQSTLQSANHYAAVYGGNANVQTCERGLDQLLVALLIAVLSLLEHDDEQDHLHHGSKCGIQYGAHGETALSRDAET